MRRRRDWPALVTLVVLNGLCRGVFVFMRSAAVGMPLEQMDRGKRVGKKYSISGLCVAQLFSKSNNQLHGCSSP